MEYCEACEFMGRSQGDCPNLKNDENKEKTMKKYKIKHKYRDGVILGMLKNGDFVLLGSLDSDHGDDRDKYIISLWESLEFNNIRQVLSHIRNHKPSLYVSRRLEELANSGNMSIVKLGLVEEIPEEPKREYMDRYEALRMVYEQGKKVAYDSNMWLRQYGFIYYIESFNVGVYVFTGSLGEALNRSYDQKLWYVI